MSKSITGAMQTHLDTEVTSLATCWEVVRRDGVTFYFTDHDIDLVFGGNTYKAATGFTRSAVEERSDLSVDNMELVGVLDDTAITVADIRAGLFDYAELKSFMVNHEDPDAFSSIKLRAGFVGEAAATQQLEVFRVDFRGLLQNYSQSLGDVYQPECRVDLGSPECGINLEPTKIVRETVYAVGDLVSVDTLNPGGENSPISDGTQYEGKRYLCTVAGTTAVSQPVYDETVGNDTVDGTATFKAEFSFTQYLTVVTVNSRREFEVSVPINDSQALDDWFKYGAVSFIGTDNSYKVFEVKSYNATTKIMELFIDVPFDIAELDLFSVYAGCNKTLQTSCLDKFDNVINYRGEPFVPGIDQALSYPNAKYQELIYE